MARGKNGRWVLLGVLGVLVAASAAVAIPALTHARYIPVLEDYGPVPSFSFTAETGARFDTASMRGHVTIVDFIFTRCDAICPTSTARMLDLQERTGDLDTKVELLSFTVDPKFDTPEVLAKYARNFHADPRRWRFVTGDLATIKPVIEGAFMSGIEDRGTTDSGAPNIFHGEKFFLVDQGLHIRNFYDTDPTGLDKLGRAARFLAAHPTAALTAPVSASARP